MSDEDQWSAPGVPWSRPAPALTADVVALLAALEQVLAVDGTLLPPEEAVTRAEVLLAAQDRLALAGVRAVADVEARDLWRVRSAGSTRTWLRTLPAGDRGQLRASRALVHRDVLNSAVEDGSVPLPTALTVARHLEQVPAHVPPDQLEAVLVDGLGDLLGVWAGAACLDPTAEEQALFDGRREQLGGVVRAALADCWSEPAGRLEAAFVLAARVLTPREVDAGLGLLVDALLPEAEREEVEEQRYRDRALSLRRLRSGGWSLRAQLTDEAGQLLFDQLSARLTPVRPLRDADAASHADAASDAASDVPPTSPPTSRPTPTPSCSAPPGPGEPVAPFEAASLADAAVQGTPLPSVEQTWHDAFARLLADAVGSTGGSGLLTAFTVVAPLEALEGRPGAPPGRLRTARGDVPLSTSRLRDHACRSLLSVVLRDARGRPVGASGQHRHATARERRVMRAAWGSTCAVNGCGLPGTVPHHVEPFCRSRQTRQADLAPLCEHHHHDVHEGHKTLRLRDGRRIDEDGWVAATSTWQRWAG